MAEDKRFSVHGTIAIILLAQVVSTTANQLSTGSGIFRKSLEGKRLQGCLISTRAVPSLFECGHWCMIRDCWSFNYGQSIELENQNICEMNNCSRNGSLVLVDKIFDYYELVSRCLLDEICSEPKFSLQFPRYSTNDYVVISDPSLTEMDALTICAWVKFVSNGKGAIITYAVPGSTNELAIWCYVNVVLISVKNLVWFRAYNSTMSDGSWHALCMTWSSANGEIRVYKDDVLTDVRAGVGIGEKTVGGGTWVLGQDQDTVGGGFDIKDSLRGELTMVNVWRRVLTRQEITKFSTNCENCMIGDVKRWTEFRTGLRGNVELREKQDCHVCD
ncbi:neuronal pentraxin-1-like isoform X2 [Dendronephthya gigantea]|uniref:neuronal pentraxin-1-like isoform X2 n=1 Tax=Dendronephthya gigantea TaxID=151771 RepID=UPI001069CCAE|nr:neuronal pentraxin-1-like isoform X2 [Dendronephthya gigantea]